MIDDARDIWEGLADPARRNAAMRALIDQQGSRLFARVRALVGEAEAEDVFQDVLIKIVQGAASFHGQSAFGTWCYRVATNECLDVLRARRRRPATDALAESFADHYPSGTSLPESATVERLVAAAMAELPPQQRLVFEERYFHETPYAELAHRLQKSEGALKANFHHAVRKVSDYLRAHVPIAHS